MAERIQKIINIAQFLMIFPTGAKLGNWNINNEEYLFKSIFLLRRVNFLLIFTSTENEEAETPSCTGLYEGKKQPIHEGREETN